MKTFMAGWQCQIYFVCLFVSKTTTNLNEGKVKFLFDFLLLCEAASLNICFCQTK